MTIWVGATAHHFTLKNLEISGGKNYTLKFENVDFSSATSNNERARFALIENCEIHHSGNDIIKITPGCNNITFKNCEIHHSGLANTQGDINEAYPNCQGIDNVNADYMIVQGCHIYEIPYSNPCVFFKGGARGCIIERNLMEKSYAGAWLGAQTDKEFYNPKVNPNYYNSIDGVVRNNIIKNMRGEGIAIMSAKNPKIYNNTLIDCGNGSEDGIALGFRHQPMSDTEPNPPTINAFLANNIIVRNSPTTNPYKDFVIEIYGDGDNNILALENGTLKMTTNRYYDTNYTDLRVRNNNNHGDFIDTSTLDSWKSSPLHNTSYADRNSIFGDPKVDSNGNLLIDSNCIGTGIAIDGLIEDFYGNPRLSGAIDIGAIQASSSLSNDSFNLQQKPLDVVNYPNPFKQTTTFLFTIQERTFVKIIIYNLLGQEVHALGGKEFEAGNHTLNFDATNLNSGTYVYKVSLGEKFISKKMVLIK